LKGFLRGRFRAFLMRGVCMNGFRLIKMQNDDRGKKVRRHYSINVIADSGKASPSEVIYKNCSLLSDKVAIPETTTKVFSTEIFMEEKVKALLKLKELSAEVKLLQSTAESQKLKLLEGTEIMEKIEIVEEKLELLRKIHKNRTCSCNTSCIIS
jgi:hypothetical protein